MNFFNNNYRKYLGLKPVKETYSCKEYIKNRDNTHYFVYYDKNKMVKILEYRINEYEVYIHEMDIEYETIESNSIILPKTDKGHQRKITCSVLDTLNGIGTYFIIYKSGWDNKYHFNVGNYTTQKFYYEGIIEEEIKNEKHIKKILDKYVEDTNEKDLKEIETFSNEKRKNIKYKEGDYFRVKFGRHKYCYGRILMDVSKRKQQGMKYWDIFMGKPIIVEMFHILTEREDMKIADLKNLPTFPAEHIMDNRLLYGDYVIIGNEKLENKVKYPIMYGRSISAKDPNKIIFQCGTIHKEIELTKDFIKNNENLLYNFRNNGIRFDIILNEKLIEKCIKSDSNEPYWEINRNSEVDIRSPKNKKILKNILKYFHLDELFDLYHN